MSTARTASIAVLVITLAGLTPALSLDKARHKHCKALNTVDPDNDGKLDLAEAKKAASVTFDLLNRDKDGTLDKRELRGRLGKRDILAGDPDKDKTLDKPEFLAIVEARFRAADVDKDGTIECKELHGKAGRALLRLLK